MVQQALHAAYKSLRPRGRIIIRDFVQPANGDQRVVIAQRLDTIPPGQTFADFAAHFSRLSRPVLYEKLSESDGVARYETTLSAATEYMLRKDYPPQVFQAELAEHYLFWTEAQAKEMLGAAGFHLVHAQRLEPSEKLVVNHIGTGTVVLDLHDQPITLPREKMLFVAEKPALSN
jgi:hypothetical protein